MPEAPQEVYNSRAIGGVFPLAQKTAPQDGKTLIQLWSDNAHAVHCFHNARSALHHVITDLAPKRLWLPAYLCPDILQATSEASTEIRYFNLTKDLQPDTGFLAPRLQGDDVILTINYFGRGPADAWLQFIENRSGTIWIEDCAQVIDTGAISTSDFCIYSPRKILGVPDGGILVDKVGLVSAPRLTPLVDREFMLPCRLRAEDPRDLNNEEWFSAFQRVEQAQTVSLEKISDVAQTVLETTPLKPMSNARLRNYNFLHDRLGDIALYPESAKRWIPLCFPVLSDNADGLVGYLAQNRIFCPRYWRDLPVGTGAFADAHMLSNMIVGLPCDQRYSEQDMDRIVNLVRTFRP